MDLLCSPDARLRSAGSGKRRSSCPRRAGSGAGGVVDDCAAGARSAGQPATGNPDPAAGTQDRLQRGPRRNRAARTPATTRGCRLRSAISRWKPSRAPMHGCWSQAAAKAMLRERPSSAYLLRDDDDSEARIENARQPRSGPVPDHPVARGRAGALRGRAVSARAAERDAQARRCARLRARRRRDGADRRAAVRPLQCRRLCGALGRSCLRERDRAGAPAI